MTETHYWQNGPISLTLVYFMGGKNQSLEHFHRARLMRRSCYQLSNYNQNCPFFVVDVPKIAFCFVVVVILTFPHSSLLLSQKRAFKKNLEYGAFGTQTSQLSIDG